MTEFVRETDQASYPFQITLDSASLPHPKTGLSLALRRCRSLIGAVTMPETLPQSSRSAFGETSHPVLLGPAHPHPFGSHDAGVILLSAPTRILHMNGRARVLMASFGDAHGLWPNLAPESMPAILVEFCQEIMGELARRAQGGEWEQLEIHRVCYMTTPPLLLRGFGIPVSADRVPRMILLLQPHSSLG
jgi:hypothetical protein